MACLMTADGERRYLDHEAVVRLLAECGMPCEYVPPPTLPLKRGWWTRLLQAIRSHV